ncbi:MAG: stalk domain-containing protein [Armatimonadota bacterium]
MKRSGIIIILVILALAFGIFRFLSDRGQSAASTNHRNVISTRLSDDEIRSVLREAIKFTSARKYDEEILLLQPLVAENAYRLIKMKPEHTMGNSIALHLGAALYWRGDSDAAMPYLRFFVDNLPPMTESMWEPTVRQHKASTLAVTQPSARVNGRAVDGVVYAKGMIFVPADTAVRLLGADMTDDHNGGWIVSKGQIRVRLSTDAVLDDTGAKGIVPARRSGPRIVMVSLRPLARQLGADTTWDSKKRMLEVEIPKTQP